MARAKKAVTKRTKPKQAGSPRSLDRWQRAIQAMLRDLESGGPELLRKRLGALLQSMMRSERR